MNATERLTKARSTLIIDQEFFGVLSMNLVPKPTRACTTMATDSKALFYNPDWIVNHTTKDADVVRVVAHEVLHCALGHCSRRGDRDPNDWNIACDHVVNLMLKAAGFVIPPNRPCDPKFIGLHAEQIYEVLRQKKEEEKKQEQPQPKDEGDEPASGDDAGDESPDDDGASDGETDSPDADGDDGESDQSGEQGDEGDDTKDGDGEGSQSDSEDSAGAGDGEAGQSESDPVCHGDPGEDGEVLDAAPSHDQAANDEAAQEWEIAVRQAVNICRRQNEGKLPGFVQQVIDKLNDPETDWRDVLRRFADPLSSTKDYSWSQPSRRMLSQGYVVPGLVSDGVHHVALLIDASYSIDEDKLATFGGETQAMLDDGGVDQLTVVWFDTRVTKVVEYGKGDIIDWEVPGRGGTAFAPAFQYVTDNCPDVACAILFSDLECSDWGPEPSFPILLAAYGNDPARLQHYIKAAPFGEAIEVTRY